MVWFHQQHVGDAINNVSEAITKFNLVNRAYDTPARKVLYDYLGVPFDNIARVIGSDNRITINLHHQYTRLTTGEWLQVTEAQREDDFLYNIASPKEVAQYVVFALTFQTPIKLNILGQTSSIVVNEVYISGQKIIAYTNMSGELLLIK